MIMVVSAWFVSDQCLGEELDDGGTVGRVFMVGGGEAGGIPI